jgi:hypothetical protein
METDLDSLDTLIKSLEIARRVGFKSGSSPIAPLLESMVDLCLLLANRIEEENCQLKIVNNPILSFPKQGDPLKVDAAPSGPINWETSVKPSDRKDWARATPKVDVLNKDLIVRIPSFKILPLPRESPLYFRRLAERLIALKSGKGFVLPTPPGLQSQIVGKSAGKVYHYFRRQHEKRTKESLRK